MSYFLRFSNIFRTVVSNMSAKTSLEHVKENAQLVKRTVEELKQELNVLDKEYNIILASHLREENAKLLAAVEEAKKKLVNLEVQNGIKQIPVPNQTINTSSTEQPPTIETKSVTKEQVAKEKPKKEKKEKPKQQKEPVSELPIDVGRLDLRIGKVLDVQRHPDADSLYVLKINIGEENPRTVCSGLVKYIPIEDLRDKTLVVLCNLKPVKMRGVTSEAMVMCASSDQVVETIIPPENSLPGDLVSCEGYTRQPDSVMNPKKKIFETVAPDLHTNDNLQACYKNAPFQVPGKGFCLSKTLKNVIVK